MVNLEHRLTVDDMIVEYAMYKVNHDYEPEFSIAEFMDFLHNFSEKIPVDDVLDDGIQLFQRFFARLMEKDWIYKDKNDLPMSIEYVEQINDSMIHIGPKLSDYNRSVINTYFMGESRVKEIRDEIEKYLSSFPKRQIDTTVQVSKEELHIGKCVAAQMMTTIWLSGLEIHMEWNHWPSQCQDIQKYLIDIDLAEVIGLDSMKAQLLEFYQEMAKRIAIMYHQNHNLVIDSASNFYLANSNYRLLTKGYEELVKTAYSPYKSSLSVNLAQDIIHTTSPVPGVYFEDDDVDYKTKSDSIQDEEIHKLVKSIDDTLAKQTQKQEA